jgi:hypothetical protein
MNILIWIISLAGLGISLVALVMTILTIRKRK